MVNELSMPRRGFPSIARLVLGAVAGIVCSIGFVDRAAAQPAVHEAAVQRLVGLVESAGAKVAIGTRHYDPATRRLELGKVVLTFGAEPSRATTLDLPTVVLTAPDVQRDRLFVARTLSIPELRARSADGSETLSVTGFETGAIRIPISGLMPIDPAKPFSSRIARLKGLLVTSVTAVSVGAIALESGPAGFSTRIASVGIGDVSEGRLDGFSVRRFETRTADGTLSIGALDLAGLDLKAYLRLVDASEYLGGIGEEAWRPFLATLKLGDLARTDAGTTIALKALEMKRLDLRQAKQPFADLLDRSEREGPEFAKDVQAAARLSASIFENVKFGEAAFEGLVASGSGAGVTPGAGVSLQVASGRLTDLSVLGLAELRLDGAVLAAPAGRVAVDSLGIGRLVIPSILEIAQEAAQGGGMIVPGRFAPQLGALRAAGVAVEPTNLGRITLAGIEIDARDHVSGIPGRLDSSFTDLVLPEQLIAALPIRQLASELDYRSLKLSGAVAGSWSQGTSELQIDTARLVVADAGTLNAAAQLTGVGREHLAQAPTADYDAIGIRRLRLDYSDASLFSRVIAAWAKGAKQTPDVMKKYLAGVVPNVLNTVPDQQIRRRFTEAATRFVQDPKSVTITSNNQTPIRVPVIRNLLAVSPGQVPVVFRLDAEANIWTPEAKPAR